MIDFSEQATRILRALEPRVELVAVEQSHAAPGMNVAIERSGDGKRHAVHVRASATWERDAIDQLLNWLDHGKGAR